jgi:ligand-binding SRPBCC domain-containing protein
MTKPARNPGPALHVINTELWLPRSRAVIFPFFADAQHLTLLAPPWLQFKLLTPPPVPLQPGKKIDYELRWRGMKLTWQSEITVWEPPHRFVEEQRRGPCKSWRHEHIFAERDGNTLVIDRVLYAVRGGAVMNFLFVQRDLNRIFAYRRRTLRELFEPDDK